MTCRYCGAWNDAEEERCERCGRRALAAAPIVSTAAPQAAVAIKPRYEVKIEPPPTPRSPRQPGLFPVQESPRVVPIFGRDPVPPPKRAKGAPRTPPARREDDTQQRLAFVATATANRSSEQEPESGIYCDAPVAHTQHRVMAAFVDAGVLVSAWTVFAAVFFFAGGEVPADPMGWIPFGILAFAIVVTYQALWVLGNGDSLGLRVAHLELVNFDGRRPNRRERAARMLAGWLSVAPAGLGLLWALVDEETLTWHDQISKTFPTPRILAARPRTRPGSSATPSPTRGHESASAARRNPTPRSG
jgi:uncharacterized RDD family membrane protein YckC